MPGLAELMKPDYMLSTLFSKSLLFKKEDNIFP